MTTSYADQLTSVQAAIAAIESGQQSGEAFGRKWVKADLKTLYAREQWLRSMADRDTRGGGARFRYGSTR